MFDLKAVQGALREFGIDAWLLYDFHGSNPLSRRILDFPEDRFTTRRWFYLIPADGEPRKLLHRIETATLDHIPGDTDVYLPWQELESKLAALLEGSKTVAMEYSPRNAIPYVSKVDGGTIELVKSFGVNVVSSGDLIQQFEATLDDAQWQTHLEAEKHLLAAYARATEVIADRIGKNKPALETEIQDVIMAYFEQNHLFTDHPPIVARNAHAGDPHYAPSRATDEEITEGDLVLIDLWCRTSQPRSVFADYTKMIYCGDTVPPKFAAAFDVVARARDAAVDLVRESMAAGADLRGWQVDDAARNVITEAGHGKDFVHRTGHNISQDLHGNGTHMDNLETRDERRILKRTCFSVEPGIYLPEFGIRSEVNVYIDGEATVHVTGDAQDAITPIL